MTIHQLFDQLRAQRRSRVLLEGYFAGDPGAGGYVLPSGLAIACATTGRTSQTSASTLRTGLGANNARGRSVDGAMWGLSVECSRLNRIPTSDPFGTGWSTSGPLTASHVTGPSGAIEACRIVDNDIAAGSTPFQGIAALAGVTVGGPACPSIWVANQSINQNGGNATGSAFNLNVGPNIAVPAPVTPWTRVSAAGTYSSSAGSTALIIVCAIGTAGASNVSKGTIDAAFAQVEDAKYPSSAFPTSGATATRAADVLSIVAPTIVGPGGFFDVTILVAPNFATAEQGTDLDLFFLDTNNRLFLQQSTAKVVLRVAGVDVLSSALTWARETPIKVRAMHTPRGRTLEVSGALTGNDTTSASAAGAVTLPGTAYLLGNASGAQECASLMGLLFQHPV